MLDYDYDIDIIFKKLNNNVKKIYIIPYFPVEDKILTISTNKDYVQCGFITIDITPDASNTISIKDISNEIQKYVNCDVDIESHGRSNNGRSNNGIVLKIIAGIFNNYRQDDNYTLLLTSTDLFKHIKLTNDINTGRLISISDIIFWNAILWHDNPNQCAIITDIFITTYEQNNMRKICQYLNDIYRNAPKKINKIISDFTTITDLRIKIQIGMLGSSYIYRMDESNVDNFNLGTQIENVKELYTKTITKICNNNTKIIYALFLKLYNDFVLNEHPFYLTNITTIQHHINEFIELVDLTDDDLDIYNKNGRFYNDFKMLFVEILTTLEIYT